MKTMDNSTRGTFMEWKGGISMIDLEQTSVGRSAYRMKLKDALETVMDNVIENMSDDEDRSVTRKEVELIGAMMRINKYIRSNPSNRKETEHGHIVQRFIDRDQELDVEVEAESKVDARQAAHKLIQQRIKQGYKGMAIQSC